MLRRRLLWFAVGFSTTAAVISHFMLRDLWADRYSLTTNMEEKFGALDTRVLHLESLANQDSNLAQHGISGVGTEGEST